MALDHVVTRCQVQTKNVLFPFPQDLPVTKKVDGVVTKDQDLSPIRSNDPSLR